MKLRYCAKNRDNGYGQMFQEELQTWTLYLEYLDLHNTESHLPGKMTKYLLCEQNIWVFWQAQFEEVNLDSGKYVNFYYNLTLHRINMLYNLD